MNIGLVLSGEDIRGAAHIGLIKTLEEHEIFPTHISGSSAGAIVGALYAYGYDWKTIFNFFKTIQLFDFRKLGLGRPSIIDTEKFYPQFRALFKDDVFAPLQIGDSFYIDGGVLNNFPVSVLNPKCDFIIGSYVNGYEAISIKDLKHSHNVVEPAFKLKSVKEDYKKFQHYEFIIAPKALSTYGTFDKKHLINIFNVGYSATLEALKNETSLTLKISKEFT